MIERVTHKIIKSGDVLEIYEYSEGYIKGYTLTKYEINISELIVMNNSSY